jgi:hypothetical protein
MHGREKKCIRSFYKKIEKINHWQNQGADGSIILKCILRKYEGVEWIHLAQDRDR